MLSNEDRDYLCEKYRLHFPNSNSLLNHIMTRIRSERAQLSPELTHSIVSVGDFVRLWLNTPACRFSQQGSCTICNYWRGCKIDNLMERVLPQLRLPDEVDTLLVNTCGSCLDPAELTVEEQNDLLAWISIQKVRTVILETHHHTLTEDTVARVCSRLRNCEVMFEVGQESLDPDVLFFSMNKPSVRTDIRAITEHIHRWGAKCIFNVILGAPMLTPKEQVEDAVSSINSMLELGADYITLFPVNIKPHTLPYYLHKIGAYQPIRIELVLEVLNRIKTEDLPYVDISWYGEVVEEGVIPPQYPTQNREVLLELLGEYNNCLDSAGRQRILKQCQGLCTEAPVDSAEDVGLAQRLDQYYTLLSEML